MMKRTIRKAVSIILVLVMVVTSLNYMPRVVEAATDYSDKTFTEATGDVGTYTYAYYVAGNTITGWDGKIEFQNTGTGMKLAYSADNLVADTKVTVNGVEKTTGDAEVNEIAAGMISLNPSVFADDAYTEIQITTTTGTADIVLRKGTVSTEEPYSKDAFSSVEAEDYDSKEGECVQDSNSSLSGTGNLGGVKNGACTGYNVYFSENASQVQIHYSSNESDASGYVDICIDDVASTPVATIELANTGSGWDTYQTLTADAQVEKGNHTVYLKFTTTNDKTHVANVDYFKFVKSSDVTTTTTEEIETSPDLTTVQANTPDVTGTDGWSAPVTTGGSVCNSDKTLNYYIATSYYVGGENAGFFNGNIYGFFDTGKDVPYGGVENNTITGEAYGFSADVIRGKLKSVWVDGVKLTANTDYCWSPTNDDVLTIGADRFVLAESEDQKVYYVTVRTTDNVDYSWPLKVERVKVDDSFTYEKGTADGVLGDTVDGLNNYVRYENISVTAKSGDGSLAIDNNGGTRWESDHNLDPQHLIVDLGATYSVKKFLIRWEAANAKDFTVEVSQNGVDYTTVATVTDAASEGNRLDTITLKEAVNARYVKINGTARNLTYGYSIWEMGIYGPDAQKEPETTPETTTEETTTEETTTEETTTEETTTAPSIDPVTPPEGAEWTVFMNSDTYYRYVPTGSEGAFKIADNQFIHQQEGLYFGMNVVPSNIKINGVEVTNIMPGSGAEMRLPYEYFSGKGAYEITFTGNDNNTYSVWVKKDPPKVYTPTGLDEIIDAENKTVRVTWVSSADALEMGCTYTVQIAGLEPVTALGEEAVVDISSLTYGKYSVTVNALLNGEVVGTATEVMVYKDPEVVDSTLTIVQNWEKFRHQELSWTPVDGAIGYAIYTDGILYQTLDADTLNCILPAYAFATEAKNRNDQPTSVGLHNTAVVALLEGDTAPESLLDVNEKRMIGKETFDLHVNYIYGNGTDLWNNTGVHSPWNFTVCEEIVEDGILEAADVAVAYDTDGAANLKINSVGEHSGEDQAWTIKAAIYDEEVGTGNFINLAFDIKGPAVLAGQEITIKCIAEEVQADGEYAGNPYEEKNYVFELETDATGQEYAVIHYSNSFESTNDTYDLLFGLGLLDPKTINDGNPIDLTLTDTKITKVYGLTSLTASPVVNVTEPDNSGIFVSWQSNVPSHLTNEYTYNVYIDGELATLPEGVDAYKNNLTYEGYAVGTHTVKVESIYNGAVTSTEETSVTIEDVAKPDLVVTDISVPEGEHHIGDTIPVSITVKNIGTAKAEGHGNLAIFPYVNGVQHGYLFVNNETENIHTLDIGESYTGIFNYTIAAEDDKGGYLFDIKAVVDGDGNYKLYESNPDNNTYMETFKFFVPITEVTLTNEGNHVKADWADHDDTNKKFIVSYYADGETEPRTIETSGNISEIELPEGVWLASGSEVTVTSVHTDGSSHTFAVGQAYSDLVISKVDIPKNAYAVGEKVPIKTTMKNIGVATAIPNGNMTLKPTKNGKPCTKADGNDIDSEYRTMADEGLEQKLNVFEEFTYTFNYTVGEQDLAQDIIYLGGLADGDYVVTELIDNSAADNGNNVTELPIKIMEKGTLTLDSNYGEGPVKATWTASDATLIKGYKLKYTTDGETYKEILIDETNVVYDEAKNEYTYTFPAEEGLYNQTDVTVMVRYDDAVDGTYYDFASDTAQVDLTITKTELVRADNTVLTEQFTVDTFEEFYVRTYIKNIGTAQVKPCTSDEGIVQEAEGINITARDVDGKVLTGNGATAKVIYTNGLSVGQQEAVDVGIIELETSGLQTISVNVDDVAWNFDGSETGIGYIEESDETNNGNEMEIDVHLVQEPMDWTPLMDSTDHSKPFEFEVSNSSIKANIEYKVLATSFTDINYKDLVTKYEGYGGFYMSLGIEDSHKIIQVNHEEGKMSYSYTNTWFQQVRKEYLVDENGNATGNVEVIDNEYLARIPSQGCDIYGYDGKFFENTSETPLGYNGNGFNFNVNSFAPGKYYMMSIVDYDKDGNELNYVTLAFRVTQELEGWSRVGASDNTDIDKLAAFYHDSNHQVNAKFFYDCSDLGLACIKAYNGTHLTLTTDTSKKLNDDVNYTKIEIAYGVYDEATGKVTEPANWDQVCVNPGIYGKEGTNNIQIDIASLMRELPLHSANGGSTDREYYFLKVYNDTENEPESFIPVPIMVEAEIPEIIPVQGLQVSNRGSMLTVNWTSTNTQITDGYLYDIYVDGELKEENVHAGSYNFTGSSTIGSQHQITVKAKWCEQVADATVDYTMSEPETEPVETIPSEKPTYPTDNKWVLINGQNVLPISQEGSFDTVNAQIWYYTDEDINSVVGYNDYYMSINGSDEYFTGESTRIYVQDGENTFFESKVVYDSYYTGQVLMNAAKLFTTYGEWKNGDTLYYTVRVAGNNGNTYKDFYFKVIPTDESPTITATGDWRTISGQYQLPVMMGENSELQGTVSFLDCPVATDKYTTGTNTYDIVGYNGYYMSIIGDNQYYTGPDTKISVSEAKDTVQYAEDAPNLTFTEKTIYDKAYPGQIIIKCAETFTVEYATTYYLLKIESGAQVTYVPVEIKVNTGNVEVLGFQMNTNQNVGGVAEKSPSFRVVSKTSKVMTINNKLHEVAKMGTVYALADEVDDSILRQNMTLEGAESNDYIQNFETTQQGKLQGYTTTEADSAYNTYFALTFKFNDYMYHTLEQNYAVRAYAVLDDGTVVYGHNVYKTNMYEIAQNLYEGQKMGTKDAHDFLYKNVLNVVDMYNHNSQISNAMFKALGITSYDDSRYELVQSMSFDIFNYARCLKGYTYQDRGEFTCSSVEAELLALLNTAQATQYDSVYEWIYNETSNYGKKDGTIYKGCYTLAEYGWDSSIDKDFYTE